MEVLTFLMPFHSRLGPEWSAEWKLWELPEQYILQAGMSSPLPKQIINSSKALHFSIQLPPE